MQSLLHAIAKLYSNLFSNLVHERLEAYHDTGVNSDDIGTALYAYIMRVKNSEFTTGMGLLKQPIPSSAALQFSNHHESAQGINSNHLVEPNPLSDYFHKTNEDAQPLPPLGGKLKASAWDHTHSAIRFAHQGDYANAKLHAVLANNAVHELGRFMSEKDFISFTQAVRTELSVKH